MSRQTSRNYVRIGPRERPWLELSGRSATLAIGAVVLILGLAYHLIRGDLTAS